MPSTVAEDWFTCIEIDDRIRVIRERHVHPFLAANIWWIRGRDRDLVVDSGLGVASLRAALPDLFARDPLLVLTHAHLDHMGGAHEFDDCAAHPADRADDPWPGTLDGPKLTAAIGLRPQDVPTPLPPRLISALPHADYDPAAFRVRPAKVTRPLADGDVIDLGDLAFEVLHVPGHTPGGLALFEPATGTLFSGDTLYDDDQLLDQIKGADPAAYRASLSRLRELPVSIVHAGHEDSFGREHMVRLIDAYLG